MTPLEKAQRGAKEAGRVFKAGHTSASETLAMSMMKLVDSANLSKDENTFVISTVLAGTMAGLPVDEQVVVAIMTGNLSILILRDLKARMERTPETQGAPS